MTVRDLPSDPVVVQAAQWLADQSGAADPVVRKMEERFGLNRDHARQAICLAGNMRLLRRAMS